MFTIDKAIGIEYVDDMWLHIHAPYGMTSVSMSRDQFEAFKSFLKECFNQKPVPGSLDGYVVVSERRSEMMDGLVFISEGPDEGHFNISIDTGHHMTTIGLPFWQINNMINSMEN